jgi:hypothetical protein
LTTLFFGIPILKRAPPKTLKPPAPLAPSRALIIQLARGPNTITWPRTGTIRNADPKSAQFSPCLYPVTGVVKADNMLLGMKILIDDRKLLHVET